MAKEAFNKKKDFMIVWLPQPSAEKKRIGKAFVWSIALYGSETWTMQKSDIKRIEAFEMWIWRRMLKISWTEHIRNDKVMKQLKKKREKKLIDTLRDRQKRWLGHDMLSHGSLVRTVLEDRLPGKKGRGRPKNATELATGDK